MKSVYLALLAVTVFARIFLCSVVHSGFFLWLSLFIRKLNQHIKQASQVEEQTALDVVALLDAGLVFFSGFSVLF